MGSHETVWPCRFTMLDQEFVLEPGGEWLPAAPFSCPVLCHALAAVPAPHRHLSGRAYLPLLVLGRSELHAGCPWPPRSPALQLQMRSTFPRGCLTPPRTWPLGTACGSTGTMGRPTPGSERKPSCQRMWAEPHLYISECCFALHGASAAAARLLLLRGCRQAALSLFLCAIITLRYTLP